MEQIDISDIEIMGKTFGIFLFRVERPLHHFLHPSCANFHFSPTSFQALRSAEIERRLPSHQKVFDIFLVAFVRARVNTSVLRFETPNYGKMRRLWGLGAAEAGLEEAMPVRSCNSADAVQQAVLSSAATDRASQDPASLPASQPRDSLFHPKGDQLSSAVASSPVIPEPAPSKDRSRRECARVTKRIESHYPARLRLDLRTIM